MTDRRSDTRRACVLFRSGLQLDGVIRLFGRAIETSKLVLQRRYSSDEVVGAWQCTNSQAANRSVTRFVHSDRHCDR
jgi:hypothetical protein